MVMRVLDLDLDFFLADCCPLAPIGQRPDVLGHEPWSIPAVINFLEEQCGLDAAYPIPGRVIETHDGLSLIHIFKGCGNRHKLVLGRRWNILPHWKLWKASLFPHSIWQANGLKKAPCFYPSC